MLFCGSLVLTVDEVSTTAVVSRLQPTSSVQLQGVWKIVEQSSRPPNGEWSAAVPPHVSLYIFTSRHYSYAFAPGAGPRGLFAGDPNRPTDLEKVAAYDSFVAGSGSYTLQGQTLTLTAMLHKNPNEMKGESLRYRVEVNGDRLRMTIVNPPFAPGRERLTVLTRIE